MNSKDNSPVNFIESIIIDDLNTGKHELVLEASDKIKLGSYSKYYNPYLTSN